MTVLERYQRIECDGVWQPSAEAQRRNVFVALGEATLVIKDTADTALAHWSLPAVERIDGGGSGQPARYRPGAGDGEELEIHDETMIEAIRTVQIALERARPHPGRLRRAVLLASVLAVVLLGVTWLPGALARHTESVLPDPLRAEIGQRILQDLRPITGAPCTAPEALEVLGNLRRDLVGTRGWNTVVVPDGPVTSAALPGRLIVLRADLVTEAPGPEALAGAILAEATRLGAAAPLLAFLDRSGVGTSLSLLTRGEVPDAAVSAHADAVLIAPRPVLPETAFHAAFAAAGIAAAPYLARAEPPEAWSAPSGAGAAASGRPPPLSDAEWQVLRTICEG